MKKRWIALSLALALALSLAAPALAADGIAACRSPQRLRVDGDYAASDLYNINGSNYIKLRDLACLLRETDSRFSVDWDAEANCVRVTAGGEYVPVGGELAAGAEDASADVRPGTQPIYIDGAAAELSVYNIRGNNYFRLRDLSPLLGFAVDYDPETNTAVVESAGYIWAPGAGDWVHAARGRTARLTVSDASPEALTASLVCEDRLAGAEPLVYEDLRFVSADGQHYETEGEPALGLRFDGERAGLTFGDRNLLIPLVWAESPLSARSSVETLEAVVRVGEAGDVNVLGGTLRPAAPVKTVSFSTAEVQAAAKEDVLTVPADLGGELKGVRAVSDSEYAAGDCRLIFEGETWTLCDKNETPLCTAEGAELETLYFPAAIAAAPGQTLRVTVEDFVVTEASADLPKARRFGQEEIAGVRYPTDAEAVDLSALSPAGLDAALPALRRLTNLKTVELMRPDGGTDWDLDSVAHLRDALPNVKPHYSFVLYGKTCSTDDTEIIFDSVPIGDEGADLVDKALGVLRECERFVLDGCGISNWRMAELRNAHPDTKVVWRVYFDGAANALTDETMLRLAFHIDDGNSYLLQYFGDVTYIDVGHNSHMSDISFAAWMPKLECAIFSGAPLTDITPLKNCSSLIWLELCFCGWLEDISVLEGHPTLKYLNISDSRVADISALDSVPLERFNCQKTRVGAAAEAHFNETHPDCLSIWRNTNEYGYGWRYDDYGYHFFWYYQQMRDVFRYDDKNFMYNHKGG